jgi:hypothetical protein
LVVVVVVVIIVLHHPPLAWPGRRVGTRSAVEGAGNGGLVLVIVVG